MKNLKQLEFLIFRRGGVSGAIRRIVKRWRGLFSSSCIREALGRKYPLLTPAHYQIQDTLDQLERWRRIRFVFATAFEKMYQCAPKQLLFKFAYAT